MFGKLALLILVLGGLSAAMLVDRQQRLDLAAEMQRTHARLRQHEQATWRLRADLAYRTRPHEIRVAIERLNVRMVPIPDRLQRPRTEASLAAHASAAPASAGAAPGSENGGATRRGLGQRGATPSTLDPSAPPTVAPGRESEYGG